MAMAIDLTNDVGPAVSMPVRLRTADDTGNAVDLRDFAGATVYVIAGSVGNGSHDIGLEESADGSAWSDVTASNVIGSLPSITSQSADAVYRFGYKGTKRYIRVKSTASNVTLGSTFGAIVVRGAPKYRPVS